MNILSKLSSIIVHRFFQAFSPLRTHLIRRTGRAGPAAQLAGDPAADLLAVAVLVPPAQRLADPVVAHLVHQTGLVVEADVLAEFAVADLAVRAGSVALAGLGLLDTARDKKQHQQYKNPLHGLW